MTILDSINAIEARGIMMTSIVDSLLKRVETDSCPDLPRNDSTRIAGTAGFAMCCPNALSNKNDLPLYPLVWGIITASYIAPFLTIYRVQNLCLLGIDRNFYGVLTKQTLIKLGSHIVRLEIKWAVFAVERRWVSESPSMTTTKNIITGQDCSNWRRRKKQEKKNFPEKQMTYKTSSIFARFKSSSSKIRINWSRTHKCSDWS